MRDQAQIDAHAERVAGFARETLPGANASSTDATAQAEFVIARVHGFLSWPNFATHVEQLARAGSPISAFEAGASAIVSGDMATLERLLREHPELIHSRSTREHRATLLHYVSANGVESYRQVSPKNIAGITRMLLAAGADVDAEADVYDGRCTALGLVATSAPPFDAGVQRDVMDVLLEHGARMDRDGLAGRTVGLVRACLANGQPEAARYLASRGAPLDLAGAAGLGRVDAVARAFDGQGGPAPDTLKAERLDGFSLACAYGQARTVDVLLDHGVEADAELKDHGEGHTGLHVAAFYGHLDVVELLLRRGARVDVVDKTWGTTPLVWALTGWSRTPAADAGVFHPVVACLVAAGANVRPELLEGDKVRAGPRDARRSYCESIAAGSGVRRPIERGFDAGNVGACPPQGTVLGAPHRGGAAASFRLRETGTSAAANVTSTSGGRQPGRIAETGHPTTRPRRKRRS